jgi:hypothetical protein
VQGDEEKSGTNRPVMDQGFTGSSLFLTLTIITMSRWYLSNKIFDRMLPLETLNFVMFYQRTAVIWWEIDRKLSFELFKGLIPSAGGRFQSAGMLPPFPTFSLNPWQPPAPSETPPALCRSRTSPNAATAALLNHRKLQLGSSSQGNPACLPPAPH